MALVTTICFLRFKKANVIHARCRYLNNQEVTYNNHTMQVDDILKISVGALMPEAALPYNNVTAGTCVANNIDVNEARWLFGISK